MAKPMKTTTPWKKPAPPAQAVPILRFQKKTFSELTAEEKDELLEFLLVQGGLIAKSGA